MSWKALDWATDSEVGSSTTKFILLLLANKADENLSCYPPIRALMAESDAGRSTVMRALKELEASGFITRQPQCHDAGARRSSRYYLNHPLAPHCSPRPNPGPPRPAATRATPHRGTAPEEAEEVVVSRSSVVRLPSIAMNRKGRMPSRVGDIHRRHVLTAMHHAGPHDNTFKRASARPAVARWLSLPVPRSKWRRLGWLAACQGGGELWGQLMLTAGRPGHR